MKNLIKSGNRIYFKGERCWYMIFDGKGQFNVFKDGEYEGKYCGSIDKLEEMPSGSAALSYVISGL